MLSVSSPSSSYIFFVHSYASVEAGIAQTTGWISSTNTPISLNRLTSAMANSPVSADSSTMRDFDPTASNIRLSANSSTIIFAISAGAITSDAPSFENDFANTRSLSSIVMFSSFMRRLIAYTRLFAAMHTRGFAFTASATRWQSDRESPVTFLTVFSPPGEAENPSSMDSSESRWLLERTARYPIREKNARCFASFSRSVLISSFLPSAVSAPSKLSSDSSLPSASSSGFFRLSDTSVSSAPSYAFVSNDFAAEISPSSEARTRIVSPSNRSAQKGIFATAVSIVEEFA